MYTDHKNLAYVYAAKRLNSHQVLWALLLTRYDFMLAYHKASKNVQSDLLS